MSNSSLVSYVRWSPNYTSGRGGEQISRITVHYVAGNCSIETLGSIFAPSSRQASSQYGIGSDGRIGQYVDECNRSWCSSSGYNDRKAVTIECANLADGSLTNACWRSLVALCADICRRNGIPRLVYTGNDSGNLTMHKWYGSTDCPGPWLSHEFGRLASEVNAMLESGASPESKPANNASGGKLDEDGIGGYNTILDLQYAVGAPFKDGFLSSQWPANRVYMNGITAVEFDNSGRGSSTVTKLQERIGAGADGIWGKETSTKLQMHLEKRGFSCGTCGVDGYFGTDSVKALQRAMNARKLF